MSALSLDDRSQGSSPFFCNNLDKNGVCVWGCGVKEKEGEDVDKEEDEMQGIYLLNYIVKLN